MAARKVPWWQAHASLLWALIATSCGAFITVKMQLAAIQDRMATAPERRDRELDLQRQCFNEKLDLVRELARCERTE